MISLYTKIPKDLHFLGLSNFSRDMLIPLACNFQSVFSVEAPMDSFCNAIVSTFMFSRSQHWAFTNYVAYWFFRTLAQPVFWADSLLVNLCLYCIGLQRWSWAAVNNPSVSFLNSPFFNHVRERLLVTPSVCLNISIETQLFDGDTICCTNQLTSTFLPRQVYSTCICSRV